MKIQTQYVYSCTQAIHTFLKDKDATKLVSKLRNIELHAKDSIPDSEKKSLWFKFGCGDTLSTDIDNIKISLSLFQNQSNYKLLIEQFELVTQDINPDNELEVYFS
jgi:hypothetical protein